MGICCGLLAILGGLKRDCAIGSARAVSMLCGQLPHDFTIGSACAISMPSGRLPHDRAIGSARAVSMRAVNCQWPSHRQRPRGQRAKRSIAPRTRHWPLPCSLFAGRASRTGGSCAAKIHNRQYFTLYICTNYSYNYHMERRAFQWIWRQST